MLLIPWSGKKVEYLKQRNCCPVDARVYALCRELESCHFYARKAGLVVSSMDKQSPRERELVLDLESGVNAVRKEHEGANDQAGDCFEQDQGALASVWSSAVGINGSIKLERTARLEDSTCSSLELPLTNGETLVNKKSGAEGKVGLLETVMFKPKKGCKKPPKPPRLPNATPLDSADQKLLREISEIEILKQARIERMKKTIKNAKSTPHNGSLWALIVTIVFLLIVIWQGVVSRSSSSVNYQGSPKSSIRASGGLISIRFYRNASGNAPQDFSSSTPSNAKIVSG